MGVTVVQLTKVTIIKSINLLLVLIVIALIIVVCIQNTNKTDPLNNAADEETFGWCEKIDEEYLATINVTASNFDKAEITLEFSKKWLSCAEQYYDLIILDLPYDDYKINFINMEDWIEYKNLKCKEFHMYTELKTQGGSIGSILCAQYEYDLCRQRAIELYQMYIDIRKTGGRQGTVLCLEEKE